MMRGGGRGRGTFRRDYSPRTEEKSGYSTSGRSNAPPSRHLWVGNLSPHMTQGMLSEQFFRFGDLESIIFLPGRSYAFVNYKKEEDAVLAIRALQGFVVAGMPLRIEFQKGDKSSSLVDGDYAQNRDERLSIERGESFQQRDSRLYSPGNSKSNRSTEPSEVLWIGFPAFLDIDEVVLRRAFSPFGEIEKITAFPGRTYAFVRYRSVVAACRAKEALQGKLFNNPRVSICFARSDGDLANFSSHPNFKSNFHLGLSERVGETAQLDGNFDNSVREFPMPSSRFFSNMEKMPRDAGIIGFGRNNLLGVDSVPGHNAGGAFEGTSFPGLGSEPRIIEDPYERYRDSPLMDQGALHHDHPVERTRRGHFEDPWDMENDPFPLAKKIRMERFPNNELPEYPFTDFDRDKEHTGPHKFFPDLAEHQVGNRGFDSMPFGLRGLPDHLKGSTHPPENDDFLRGSDALDAGPGPVHVNPSKLQMQTPKSHQPVNNEWKWEGTIAKGGTPVCRARCFPVGKVLDVMLPEFLDCTARTGLDMLARHFYQAASSWVVFFVAESDADIVFYNEFMHYLGEKQRAAVAKLGDKTTLFLVPPSDFSEQVLKVPGKVSISGVILRFQQATSNFSALHHPLEADLTAPPCTNQAVDKLGFQDDPSQRTHAVHDHGLSQGQGYISSSSENQPSTTAFPALNRPPGVLPRSGPPLPSERMPNSVGEGRYDQLEHQNPSLQSNWPPYDVHIANANVGSHTFENPMGQEYPLQKPISMQGAGSSHYTPGNSDSLLLIGSKSHQQETKPQLPSSAPVPSLHPEQLAQLTALIEQQKRLGKEPVLSSKEDHRQVNLLDKTASQAHAPTSNPSVSQFSQVQQMQQFPSNIPIGHQVVNPEPRGSQHALPSGKEETEGDPQKRLQATLQLAAALLQQIQHQSKSDQQ